MYCKKFRVAHKMFPQLLVKPDFKYQIHEMYYRHLRYVMSKQCYHALNIALHPTLHPKHLQFNMPRSPSLRNGNSVTNTRSAQKNISNDLETGSSLPFKFVKGKVVSEIVKGARRNKLREHWVDTVAPAHNPTVQPYVLCMYHNHSAINTSQKEQFQKEIQRLRQHVLRSILTISIDIIIIGNGPVISLLGPAGATVGWQGGY